MNTTQATREQWLNESAALLFDLVLTDSVRQQHPIPPHKISVAPMRSKTLGTCHRRAQSDAQLNEIFITAHISDSLEVLAVLTHELIHATDDCESGHRNFFASAARKAGLIGKLTATTAGPELLEVLAGMVDILGPIPHAKLSTPPKSKGRNNNKIVCTECGFQANLSRKWADLVAAPATCPVCAAEALEVEISGEPRQKPAARTFSADELKLARFFASTSTDCCGAFYDEENMSYVNLTDAAEELHVSLRDINVLMSRLEFEGLIVDTGESARGSKHNDFVACPLNYADVPALADLVTGNG